ncbi:hypothetical protein ACEPAI_6266 [Sanghuangporus weigelae]
MADASAAAPVPAVVPEAEQQEGKVVEDQPASKKIFAGNLSYGITSEDLKKFFATAVGEDILSCEVIQRRTRRGERSAGYGFVEVATDDAVNKAIDELNGQELEGRTVVVNLADSDEQKEKKRAERKVKKRVGRRGSKAVPGEVTEAEANGEAEKPVTSNDAEGEDKPKKKKRSNTKKFKRAKKAAATGENGAPAPAEAAEGGTAPAAEGEKKKKPKPKRTPRPRRPAGEEPTGEQSKTTLFVANLPFAIDDDSLAEVFKKAEFTVTTARVVRWRYGHPRKSKGYGFVSFADEAEQQKALEAMQDAEIPDGKEGVRKITLKIAIDAAHSENEEAEKGDAPASVEADA